MVDKIVAFANEHVLILTLVFFGIFVLSEVYLVPEDKRFGKGEIQNLSALKDKLVQLRKEHLSDSSDKKESDSDKNS